MKKLTFVTAVVAAAAHTRLRHVRVEPVRDAAIARRGDGDGAVSAAAAVRPGRSEACNPRAVVSIRAASEVSSTLAPRRPTARDGPRDLPESRRTLATEARDDIDNLFGFNACRFGHEYEDVKEGDNAYSHEEEEEYARFQERVVCHLENNRLVGGGSRIVSRIRTQCQRCIYQERASFFLQITLNVI